MGAFEQSLTTLNTRLRQLTTLNDNKDREIVELRNKLCIKEVGSENSNKCSNDNVSELTSKILMDDQFNCSQDNMKIRDKSDPNSKDELVSSSSDLKKQVDDLRRQLVEKDRLLTDMRLEALSFAHQMEQLESKLNRDTSLVNQTDDEGFNDDATQNKALNQSPSDSVDNQFNCNANSNTSNSNNNQEFSYLAKSNNNSPTSFSKSRFSPSTQNGFGYNEDKSLEHVTHTDVSDQMKELNLNWPSDIFKPNNQTKMEARSNSNMTLSPNDNQSTSQSSSDHKNIINNGNLSDADQPSLRSSESSSISYEIASLGGKNNVNETSTTATTDEHILTNRDTDNNMNFLNSLLMTTN